MNMQSRLQLIEDITVMIGSTHAVEAAYSTGDDSTEMSDIRILCVPKNTIDAPTAYKKLNYFFTNELKPETASFVSREPSRIIKQFNLPNGFVVTLSVIESRLVSVSGWWRVLRGAPAINSSLGGRETDVELVAEPKPAPEPEPVAEAMPEPEPVQQPVVEAPVEFVPAAAPEQAEEPQQDGDEYWDYVAKNIRSARLAINSGSYIRAGEIISLLRHMLIELICVRNDIEENFENAIDFIECEEKDMLIKSYPAALDKAPLIKSLGIICELFDRLA